MIDRAINLLIEGKNLDQDTCTNVAREIISGNVSDTKISAFLTSLRMKGETSVEIASFVKVMKEYCLKINPSVKGILVDTCGTGGDELKTFNISTIASFIVASAGIPVAKHGNRSITSKCGSADILEAMGVNLNLTPKQVEKTIEKIGIGFMFAPLFHPAMKNVQAVRKEIGIRTIFNILGPLTNPAGVKTQIIGVYSKNLTRKIAESLKEIGINHALVVHGSGMDEISTLDVTNIAELKNGFVKEYTIHPKDFNLSIPRINDLQAKDLDDSVKIFKDILAGKNGSKLDIVLLNAAAGIVVGKGANTISEGINIAYKLIESGKVLEKFKQLREETKKYET